MKIKAVSGITLYVADPVKSADFYESIGFDKRKEAENGITIYSNWFWINLISIAGEEKPTFQKEAHSENKGAGMFVYLSVDNVDEVYNEVVKMGLKPSSEPKDWPWGNREFVLRDPDGYKLVIFKRNK